MSQAGSFWARRRAAVQAEEAALARAEQVQAHQARAEELEQMDDAEALEALGLPDPQTLEAGDDFAAFLKEGVPEKFRRVALRKLWRSNPVLANVDGLNEYDDDYRKEALGQVVKTAYQVGKGMMAHVEEMQRKADAESAPDNDRDEEDTTKVERVASADASYEVNKMHSGVDGGAPQEEVAAESDRQVASDETPAPRRMRFSFEEASA